MSVSSTSASYNYLSFDAARAAFGRVQDDAAEQVRNSIANQLHTLQPGTTITARYEYTVGEDGALLPTQTQITTSEADEAEQALQNGNNKQRSRQTLTRQGDRQQSFSDIAKPRALLSPSDELALFSSASAAEQTPVAGAIAAPLQGEAVADDGSKVDVEILTPQLAASQQKGAQILNLSAQQQSNVAALYARNNDIVFSEAPAARLAA